MAKRSIKTELSETTAVPAVVADAPLSNMPALPTEQFIKAVAAEGFTFKSAADIANGRATQSIAYSCMALHVLWRNDGPPDIAESGDTVPDLAGIIHTRNKDDKTKLKAWFVEALIGAKIDFAAEQFQQRAIQETERSNKTMLISRAMNMAAILVECGVSHTQFNPKTHCFTVLADMLTMPGWTGLGRLANPKALIALDRRPCAGLDEKESFKRWVASVEQLNKVVRAKLKLKPARSSAAKMELAKLPMERIAAEVPASTLIASLRSIMDTMERGGKLTPDAFTAPVWNLLSDIAQMNDAVQNSEAFKLYREHGVSSEATVASADAKQIEAA